MSEKSDQSTGSGARRPVEDQGCAGPPASSFAGVLAPLQVGANLVRAYVLEPRDLQSSAASLATACIDHFVRSPRSYQVRTVPGVMFQIMLPTDEHIEMRLHVYVNNCEETYIHNHAHLFATYGVYGAYEERLWRVIPAQDDIVYRFRRYKSGLLAEPIVERGSLRIIGRRYQFEGNCLVVEPETFHSIAPMPGSPAPITLIMRSKKHSSSRTTVLSSSRNVDAPTAPIQDAQEHEIERVRVRLASVLEELKQRSGEIQ